MKLFLHSTFLCTLFLVTSCSVKNNNDNSLFKKPNCLSQKIANVVVNKGLRTTFASKNQYDYYTLHLRRYNGTYKVKVSAFEDKEPELEVSYYHTNCHFNEMNADDLWFQETIYGPLLLVYVTIANDSGVKGAVSRYKILYRPDGKGGVRLFSPHSLFSTDKMKEVGVEEFIFQDNRKTGGNNWWYARGLDQNKINAEYEVNLLEIAKLLNLHQ